MNSKKTFGWFLMLLGVAVMLYGAVWLCFVGGIVQIVDGAKAYPTSGWMIIWGILRVLVGTGLAFWTSVAILLFGVRKIRQKTIAEEIVGVMGSMVGVAAGVAGHVAEKMNKSDKKTGDGN